MSRGYPLEAAVLDRQGKRARREAELAAAVRAYAAAQVAAGEALLALNDHLARRPTLGQAGASASASGRELKREAAFARRHADEAEQLRAAHAAALAREETAAAAVGRARAALGDAHAAEQVIERDRERFAAADRKLKRDAEQDEIDDQQAARRPRPR